MFLRQDENYECLALDQAKVRHDTVRGKAVAWVLNTRGASTRTTRCWKLYPTRRATGWMEPSADLPRYLRICLYDCEQNVVEAYITDGRNPFVFRDADLAYAWKTQGY